MSKEEPQTSEVLDTEHGNRAPRLRPLMDFVVVPYEEVSVPIRNFVNTHPSTGKYLLISLTLVSVSLDPLFFYIPVVNNDSNCLGFDNKLRGIVVIFRSFIDAVYTILMWRNEELLHHRTADIHILDFLSRLAVVIAILPLPQAVVLWQPHAVSWLKFIMLIQFVPRGYMVKLSYKYERILSRSINTWLVATFYLLLFVLVSNVLGAFWYLGAIERNINCWRKACKTRGLCSLRCGDISSNNRYLDEFCLMPPSPNSTFIDHGIYLDAFQREIIGIHTNFFNKLFYCLWWGLQNLSSLGQNLNPGTHLWDRVFAIIIVISGLFFLAFLIGNMQVYLQKEAASDVREIEEKEKIKKQKKKLEEEKRMKLQLFRWPLFDSLPPSLRKKVLSCEEEEWLQTTEVNLGTLLNNIRPFEIRREIRQELSKNLFSKVEEFEKLPEIVRKKLRDVAKARIFPENTAIIVEGNPIYEMVHIVIGKVLIYKKDGRATTEAKHVEKNECFGEEVLEAALRSPTPTLTFATRTFHSLTKVEAFTLSFDDIVAVFKQHVSLLPSYREEWAISVCKEMRRNPQRARCSRMVACNRDPNSIV